jgi:hypothetical protein
MEEKTFFFITRKKTWQRIFNLMCFFVGVIETCAMNNIFVRVIYSAAADKARNSFSKLASE